MLRSVIIVCFSLLWSIAANAQQVNIIPQPVTMKIGTGSFLLTSSTVLVVRNGVDDNTADFFINYLKDYFGLELKKARSAQSNFIELLTLQTLVPGKEDAYTIAVNTKSISIQGQSASGTFYGMQSLIQLLPVENRNDQLAISAVTINDEPRFNYRGMHLDVCRHFFPVSFVKKYIDYLALHKLNTLHWHLTDDQGWSIQVRKYPKLTDIGAWRNGTIIGHYPGKGNDNRRYGGYYTHEEIKEVVNYAKERFIEVIPEIEMPGHSSAAIAAYPWLSCFPGQTTDIPAKMISDKSSEEQKNGRIKLVQETWGVFDDVFCAGNDSVFTFLENVIDEVADLFPSKYFHVGGDECPKTHWKICPKCQKRMKELGLKNEHELQSYFIQRIEKYLNNKGKTLIGWDEILEGGLAPNAVVMSWRGEKGGIEAAMQHHQVIMTPGSPLYFDHSQSENEDSLTIGGYNPIEKVYAYDPVPKELSEEEGKYILGAQANLWTEYIEYPSKVEYMIFPRMAALSEVLWSKKENKDWKDFEKRLRTQFKRYDQWKVNSSKVYFDLKSTITPTSHLDGVNWNVSNGYENGYLIFRRYDEFQGTDTQPRYTASHPTNFIYYEVHTSPWWRIHKQTQNSGSSMLISKEGKYEVKSLKVYGPPDYILLDKDYPVLRLEQQFHFNKATGKKITLITPASSKYPGDGVFTLVNGVQNEKGLAKAKEFLGFEGTDCEAIIDLGRQEEITDVIAHVLDYNSSWIYMPSGMSVYISDDGEKFKELEIGKSNLLATFDKMNGYVKANFEPAFARYVKIRILNSGIIADGSPGAGNKAWLFVDEIEIN